MKLKKKKFKNLNNEWNIADIITSRNGSFPFRRYLVIPNVYWGFGLNYECDLLVMSNNRVLYEIEIKSSIADLKNDFKKHRHKFTSSNSDKIKYKYYALPNFLLNEETIEMIPKNCGIIEIDIENKRDRIIRKPVKNKKYVKLTQRDYETLLRLGIMRYWSARQKLFLTKHEGIMNENIKTEK